MAHWCFMALNCVVCTYNDCLRKKECHNVLLFHINHFHYKNTELIKKTFVLKNDEESGFIKEKTVFQKQA